MGRRLLPLSLAFRRGELEDRGLCLRPSALAEKDGINFNKYLSELHPEFRKVMV